MKNDRQIIFDKFGGKCAYCGCDLLKGWHVDHLKPVRREMKYDRVKQYWVPTGMMKS